MNNLLQVIYYLSMIVSAFWIGFAVVLLSKRKQKNWLPKSFLYGTSIMIIGAYWTSYLFANGLRGMSRWLLGFLLMCSVVIYVCNRKKIVNYLQEFIITDAINLLLCVGLGTIPLILIIVYGAIYPYCDGYTYICNADYLMDYGYRVIPNPDETVLHPWLSQTLLYQTAHFRIGAQMFLALFSALFDVRFSIELFMPVTAYGVFCVE